MPVDVGELLVSDKPNRSNAVPLDGARLSGVVYIFAEAPADATIRSVDFFLDGRKVRTERFEPYDFNGGTASAANGFNVSRRLDRGRHTIDVVFKTTTGNVTTSATFRVPPSVCDLADRYEQRAEEAERLSNRLFDLADRTEDRASRRLLRDVARDLRQLSRFYEQQAREFERACDDGK